MRQVVVHLLLVVVLLIMLLVLVFFYLTPTYTRQENVVVMPRLVGGNIDSVMQFAAQLPIELVVQDSNYSLQYRPGMILNQYPLPGTTVKPGRKVYLTICPKDPPEIPMPKLTEMSYMTAIAKLRSHQLELGQIRFEPDIAKDIVLEQRFNNQPIQPGVPIKMGSRIDLIVGSGIGEQFIEIPDLTGLTLEQAKTILEAHMLRLGNIRYDENAQAPYQRIFRQNPPAYLDLSQYRLAGYDKFGKPIYRRVRANDSILTDRLVSESEMSRLPKNKIRPGEMIDIWISNNPDYSTLYMPPLNEEEPEDLP